MLASPYVGEVIVVDGSTDATPKILAALDDPRLRILTQPVDRGRTPAMATAGHRALSRSRAKK